MGDVHADLDELIGVLAELLADDPPPSKSEKTSKSLKAYWDSPAGQARRKKCSRHPSSPCSCKPSKPKAG